MAQPIHHEPQTDADKKEERVENIIAVLILLAIIVACVFLYLRWNDARHRLPNADDGLAQRFDVPVSDGYVLGDMNAPVTIIEFSDYGCEACGAFERDKWPQLKADYIDTGKARFAYRDYPLESLHEQSFNAALAAACAADQGKFWQYHDALYLNQARHGPVLFTEIATTLGLDLQAFSACVDSRQHEEKVRRDIAEGINKGGVVSTPTFFINGVRVRGNQEYAVFQAAIDAAYGKYQNATRR